MARLVVRLGAIRHNAALIGRMCAERGLKLTAVTKGVCGDPRVVREIVAAGVSSLGDSRLDNIRRMRRAGIQGEFHLIRMPAPQEIGQVLELVDVSYHSEVEVVRRLAAAAADRGLTHRVVLMVDVGDRREGVMPEDVPAAVRDILGLPGVTLWGLGMNVGCVSGVQPTPVNLGLLAELAADVEARFGHRLALVSGASSLAVPLIAAGTVPPGVNHARIGAAILTGDYDTWTEPVPGARHDGFELRAPVIEVKRKPSLPAGEVGRDAFGRRPVFEDRGPMLRVICALGRQDTYVEGIQPLRGDLSVVAASSDHLILDATRAEATARAAAPGVAAPGVAAAGASGEAGGGPPRLGEEVAFRLLYGAILLSMQSPAVEKVYVDTEET